MSPTKFRPTCGNHRRCAVALAVFTFACHPAFPASFYVGPTGSDQSTGTEAQPLATLTTARDAARKAGAGPHRIVLLPGDYFFAKTLVLDARDNGLTIEAAPVGQATLYGGRLVRDVVKMGEGYGVSAYYLDEGAQDCVVERNVSIGVERPTHNHIARDIIIRDNTFIAEANMTLSFQRSSDCTLSGNLLFAPGRISVSPPNAIKLWSNNLVFRGGVDNAGAPQPFTIDDAMPAASPPARRTAPIPVQRIGRAVRFVARPYGKTKDDWKSGWRSEWAIPFEALGLKPAPGLKVAFNLGVFRAEDGFARCLEGTLAENWRLEQAATLQFK